jgi:hypothetical protein
MIFYEKNGIKCIACHHFSTHQNHDDDSHIFDKQKWFDVFKYFG